MHAYMHEYVTRYCFESNASFWKLELLGSVRKSKDWRLG